MAKSCHLSAGVRVYLCGSVAIECGGRMVSDGDLGGRQGRLLFVFLMSRSPHPVSKAELIRGLWSDSPPPSADTALNAVISKLRRVLRHVGATESAGILTEVGTYRLVLPASWVDLE